MQILRSIFGFGGNQDTATINSNPGSNSDTTPTSIDESDTAIDKSDTATQPRSRAGTLRGKSLSARTLRYSINPFKNGPDVNPPKDRYDVCIHTLIKVKTSETKIEEKLNGRVYFVSFHEENKSNDILNIEGYIFFPIELVGREVKDNELTEIDTQAHTLEINAKKIALKIEYCVSEIVSKQTGYGGHKYGGRPLSIELGTPSTRLKRLSGFTGDKVTLEDLYLPEGEADRSN